jgi:hypothetical protein
MAGKTITKASCWQGGIQARAKRFRGVCKKIIKVGLCVHISISEQEKNIFIKKNMKHRCFKDVIRSSLVFATTSCPGIPL